MGSLSFIILIMMLLRARDRIKSINSNHQIQLYLKLIQITQFILTKRKIDSRLITLQRSDNIKNMIRKKMLLMAGDKNIRTKLLCIQTKKENIQELI